MFEMYNVQTVIMIIILIITILIIVIMITIYCIYIYICNPGTSLPGRVGYLDFLVETGCWQFQRP